MEFVTFQKFDKKEDILSFSDWYLMTLKKTLPNGEIVHSYTLSDRKHGKRMFIIGLVFITIGLAIKLFKIVG